MNIGYMPFSSDDYLAIIMRRYRRMAIASSGITSCSARPDSYRDEHRNTIDRPVNMIVILKP